IGVSLVICSLDRFVPLHRALKMQSPKRHKNFLSRQRLFSETVDGTDEDKQRVAESLKLQKYRVTEKDGNYLAEKGRFSRWGPYVNHIGLIIILFAALLRMTPFMFLDDYVWVREGEQTIIPGTDGEYLIENKKFTIEHYDESDERFRDALMNRDDQVVKNYQSDVIIYKVNEETGGELEKFIEDEIRMNEPLKFDGYTLYQAGYQQNEFTNMSF